MDIQLLDVAVRLYDTLDAEHLHVLEEVVRELEGVVSIHIAKNPHVMLVEYNPERTSSTAIIDCITQHGFNAELAVPQRI